MVLQGLGDMLHMAPGARCSSTNHFVGVTRPRQDGTRSWERSALLAMCCCCWLRQQLPNQMSRCWLLPPHTSILLHQHYMYKGSGSGYQVKTQCTQHRRLMPPATYSNPHKQPTQAMTPDQLVAVVLQGRNFRGCQPARQSAAPVHAPRVALPAQCGAQAAEKAGENPTLLASYTSTNNLAPDAHQQIPPPPNKRAPPAGIARGP